MDKHVVDEKIYKFRLPTHSINRVLKNFLYKHLGHVQGTDLPTSIGHVVVCCTIQCLSRHVVSARQCTSPFSVDVQEHWDQQFRQRWSNHVTSKYTGFYSCGVLCRLRLATEEDLLREL